MAAEEIVKGRLAASEGLAVVMTADRLLMPGRQAHP
jgi:hypothetical protein